jgi:Transposase zinc-binding domain
LRRGSRCPPRPTARTSGNATPAAPARRSDITGGASRRRPSSTRSCARSSRRSSPALASTARGRGLPAFVERELRAYLDCGILARGFARVRCPDCGFERLVAFSCKAHVCPSCATRRMEDGAECDLPALQRGVPRRTRSTRCVRISATRLCAFARCSRASMPRRFPRPRRCWRSSASSWPGSRRGWTRREPPSPRGAGPRALGSRADR